MPIQNVSYPFDPTGTAPTNLVQNERQILPPPNAANFVLLIPFAAPYFRSSLQVIYVPTGATLTEGVDYYCTHYFYEATTKVGQPIYGSVTMIDRALVGTVEFRYQTIGGDWTVDTNTLQQILGQTLLDPRHATWEQIVELPYQFPPMGHDHDVNTDLTGMGDVIDAIHDIAQAIVDNATGANESHINDKNNPHETTKAQVGLSLVANYPPANVSEATAGLVDNRYMTPALTKVSVTEWVGNTLNSHISNVSNPHGVTKTQVGLPMVENFPMATLPEALAGLAGNRYMNPAGTKALIEVLTGGSIATHTADHSNPHGVTKAQVGLSNVPNYAMASPQETLDGATGERLISPLLLKMFFDTFVGDEVDLHKADFNNPHGVTKSQVGLSSVLNLPLASLSDAEAGVADSGYMTPRLVGAAIAALTNAGAGSAGLTVHLADHANPHQVTAAQVGAYTVNEVDGLLGNKLSLNGTAQNASRLGGLLPSDLVAQSRNRFEWEPINSEEIDDGNGGTNTIHAGTTYTLLAYYTPPSPVDPAHPPKDLIFYFTGGDRRDAVDIPMYLIKVNIHRAVKMEVEQLAGEYGAMDFGYVVDGATGAVSVFVKSPPMRNGISALTVSDPAQSIGITSVPSDYQPVGWQTAIFQNKDSGIDLDAVPGELSFGYNPHMSWPAEPDTFLQHVTVIEGSGDEGDAQLVDGNLSEEYHNWIAQSAFGLRNFDAVAEDMRLWKWDNAIPALWASAAGTSLCTLRDYLQYDDYSFEVELSSTSNGRHSMGVCAAGVRLYGRDYGIYVLRNPGATTAESAGLTLPGGDIYKHLTIVLNPFQPTAVNLGSVTTGVNGSSDGWDLAGPCRIKVTKSGSTLTIKTGQLGAYVVDEALTVTIDLDSSPSLQVFKRPTSWGVATYKQADAKFKIITRPGKYRPYVIHSVTAGNDASTYHDYNGASWNAGLSMALNRHFIKPGRLYYSEMTGKLYSARRDGTLKLLTLTV